MPVKVEVDIEQIAKTIGVQARVMEPQMANAAIIKFNYKKREFLKNFLENDTSKEIAAGERAHTSLFSWGSLFSFIGFEKGTKPIDELYNFFESSFMPPAKGGGSAKSIDIVSKKRIDYTFVGHRPNLNEIEDKTHWPWKGSGSWALDIEKGKFLYYAYYIYVHPNDAKASRSGPGLENKRNGKLVKLKSGRDDKPQGRPYLRKLLNDFDNSF